jgi:hypothetical protein
VEGEGSIRSKMIFWAKAIGSKGQYSAGETFHQCFFNYDYPHSGYSGHIQAHKELISKLIATGWEPTGDRGNAWYEVRFRRRNKQ